MQELKEKLLADYHAFTQSLNGENKPFIRSIRDKAIDAFKEGGFPVTKQEEWKYTNLKPFLTEAYSTAKAELSPAYSEKGAFEKYWIPELESHRLVFINGLFAEELSHIQKESKAFVGTLKQALSSQQDLLEQHLGKIAPIDYNDGLTALNMAFMKDGFCLHVPKGVTMDYPVQVLSISDNEKNTPWIQPHNLMVMEAAAHATVYSHNVSLGKERSMSNVVTEIAVAQDANLTFHQLINDVDEAAHVHRTFAQQEKNSIFTHFSFNLNAGFIRNDLNIEVNGEHAETNMYGLYLPKRKQLMDNHTTIDHKVPNCNSNELYKGVLNDTSVGVFNGKVYVRQDAQKTNAFQSNKNILLSDKATMNTKPQLEIWADDVQCSHGATSGQLEKEPIFYMMSRGIPAKKAKVMMVYAFAAELFDALKADQYKAFVDGQLQENLVSY